MLITTNPSTGEEVARWEPHRSSEVEARIELADARHRTWRTEPFDDRAAVLLAVAGELESRCDDLAERMAVEMGKPLADGRAEIDKCAWVCRYYAEHAEAHLADETVATDHRSSYIHHEPLGVVLAVMPWNFPFWQVFRFVAPALMAGNAALLKHASNVTGCALDIESVLQAGGVPEGLFSTLLLPSDRVAGVIEHDLVRAVTLTGSEPAGRSVAATAGAQLKKTVLELGGSDPYVVLADADLEHAADVCAASRLTNGGQSCIAAKRFIVEDSVYDEFIDRLAGQFSQRVVGDPLDDDTDIGPMARIDLRDECHEQVTATVSAGARLVCGGDVPDGPGAFYPPTIVVDVEPDMVAGSEEVFGPAAAVSRAVDSEDALRQANGTRFGLGAAVFTSDLERGEEIAATRLEAGCCFVNAQVASDPRLPFGGIKQSGYGRELSHLGIREFVNAKTVVVG